VTDKIVEHHWDDNVDLLEMEMLDITFTTEVTMVFLAVKELHSTKGHLATQ
jgi:hypothetical protein